MVLCWLDLLCQRTNFPVFCQGLIGRKNKSAQAQTKRWARVQISDLATRAMQQRSKSLIWVTPLLIAEKQEQNRKNSISSLSSSDFRSSPKKYFFGIEFGWCFSDIEVYVCKAEDKLPRDWQGSAEGTSASFFPYFDEHQNMVADMVQYKFCVQERSARLCNINFVFSVFWAVRCGHRTLRKFPQGSALNYNLSFLHNI